MPARSTRCAGLVQQVATSCGQHAYVQPVSCLLDQKSDFVDVIVSLLSPSAESFDNTLRDFDREVLYTDLADLVVWLI